MQMPGRKYAQANAKYRYGFNGKENDNEVKGEGNQLDYGMRIYDPRLGKFLSVDPLTKDFPELTPYQFASNRPIEGIDQDGLEFISSFKSMQARKFESQTQIDLAKPKPREIEIMVWNPYRGQAQIGRESVVRENIAIARNNYNSAVAANISGGPFGAASYMINPEGGGFAGAAVDGVVMSFGGIPAGKSSVFPSLNNSTVTEPYRTDVEINLKPRPSVVIAIPRDRYPESAQHADEAAKSGVKPSGILNRAAAKQQRAQNLRGTKTSAGKDRDEFPPAVLKPTSGVSVKHINPSDNRGAGNFIMNQLRNVPDNTQVKIQTGVYKLQ